MKLIEESSNSVIFVLQRSDVAGKVRFLNEAIAFNIQILLAQPCRDLKVLNFLKLHFDYVPPLRKYFLERAAHESWVCSSGDRDECFIIDCDF